MIRLAAVLACISLPAFALDYVESFGPLSDRNFYRLVACAAPPDQPCTQPFYKWHRKTVTVGIVEQAALFQGARSKHAEAALARTVQHLNAVGMGVHIRTSMNNPDIAIRLMNFARGEKIHSDTILNGKQMANAITALDVKNGTIQNAAIGFSNTLGIRQYESVMLEEVTQALGLITDIRNPYYQTRSIMSQDADNSLKTLGIQDRMSLMRHYPSN